MIHHAVGHKGMKQHEITEEGCGIGKTKTAEAESPDPFSRTEDGLEGKTYGFPIKGKDSPFWQRTFPNLSFKPVTDENRESVIRILKAYDQMHEPERRKE